MCADFTLMIFSFKNRTQFLIEFSYLMAIKWNSIRTKLTKETNVKIRTYAFLSACIISMRDRISLWST